MSNRKRGAAAGKELITVPQPEPAPVVDPTQEWEPGSLPWRWAMHPSRSRFGRPLYGLDKNHRWLAAISMEDFAKPCLLHYDRVENIGKGKRGDYFRVWLWHTRDCNEEELKSNYVIMDYHYATIIDQIRILTTVGYAHRFGVPYHVLGLAYIESKPVTRGSVWCKRA